MNPTKKPWTKPEIKRFETPEQLLESYRKTLREADLQKFAELFERLRQVAQRNAGSAPLRRSAQR
jgi:hypothetical protein